MSTQEAKITNNLLLLFTLTGEQVCNYCAMAEISCTKFILLVSTLIYLSIIKIREGPLRSVPC